MCDWRTSNKPKKNKLFRTEESLALYIIVTLFFCVEKWEFSLVYFLLTALDKIYGKDG
jgi:hypothetical protein